MNNRAQISMLKEIHHSFLASRFVARYRRLFSVHEIESDGITQTAMGGLLLALLFSFSGWIQSNALTVEGYRTDVFSCWPYFQECGRLHILHALPYGYSQSILYAVLIGIIGLVAYCMYRRQWTYAHMALVLLWLWKVLCVFVLTRSLAGNYDYYDTILLTILLFFPNKFLFLRVTFVALYFFASTIKIDEGWILGTYFTSLQTGMPLFSSAVAPLITNIVIFMQMVGSFFLLSKQSFLRHIALTYFILFHLYSEILVGYRYPVSALVMLVILFGLAQYRPLPAKWFEKKNWWGLGLLVALCISQLYPILFIRGDQKMTLEGNMYGLYMFEANHQCRSRATVYLKDGSTRSGERSSVNARGRCDPYSYWFILKQLCLRDSRVDRIEWKFDHSINGGPFYRIVDQPNICDLTYKPFTHNEWIRTEKEMPPIVGYPVRNIYF